MPRPFIPPAGRHSATLCALRRPGRAAPLLTAAAAAVLALLPACTTQAVHPSVEIPTSFSSSPADPAEPEAAWWEAFHDPELSRLIRRAALENRDVRIAAERLRAARAGQTVSQSLLWPSLNATGAAGNRTSGYDLNTRQVLPDTKALSGGLDVAWELDLSGRLRAGATAADADALAAEDAVRGVRLLVISDVATNYFMLSGALRQIETLRNMAETQDETLRLVTARQRVGLASSFDVERARSAAASAHAAIPPLQTLAAVSRHRIAVLTGDQAFQGDSLQPAAHLAQAPLILAGQPAALLKRRPDVLALMAQLDAANARRQEAAAEWFPRLFLDASFGREKVGLNGIDLGAARFTNVAGILSMPIFNAGRTQALNDIAESGQREAALRAEDGIVRALEDVENALASLSQERLRAQSMSTALEAADAALERATSLYDRGQTDMLPLLDAQRARLSVRLAADNSQTQLLLDSVQLYKALGGGWQLFEPSEPRAASAAASGASAAPRS